MKMASPTPGFVGHEHVGAVGERSAVLAHARDGVAVHLLRPREPRVVEPGAREHAGRAVVERARWRGARA